MDNRAFAAEIYAFLKDNDSVGRFDGIPETDSLEEIEGILTDPQMIGDTIEIIEEIADVLDDHQYYITDVEPILNRLRGIQKGLEAEQSRRMVADTGYEVKHAIRMGDREILLAVNMNDPDGNLYSRR